MVQAFHITRPKRNAQSFVERYLIVGRSSYETPGLRCPACGGVRPWPLRYPGIDTATLGEDIVKHLSPGEGRRREYMKLDEFEELSSKLVPHLGPERPLMPLADLGPTRGKAFGRFDHLNWGHVDHLLLRRSTFEMLVDAGFKVTGFPARLTYRRERKDPLIELEILPSARLHASLRPKPCKRCGFTKHRPRDTGSLVEAASFDEDIPLQRIRERPDIVLANASLAAFLRERRLTGFELSPWAFM